jgi:hypothetical protein
VGHTWSYLPDVARTVVELLEKGPFLEPFATFHTRDHLDADGTQMINAIRRVVTRRTGIEPRIAPFPWWLLTVESLLGRVPHTALDEAVATTLTGLGCLLQDVSRSLQR